MLFIQCMLGAILGLEILIYILAISISRDTKQLYIDSLTSKK